MIACITDDPAASAPSPTAQPSASGAFSTGLPSEEEVLGCYAPHLNRLAAWLCHGDPHLRQDLFQEGATALVCVARRFDSQRGTRFSTLAYRHMRGRMLNFLRAERHH